MNLVIVKRVEIEWYERMKSTPAVDYNSKVGGTFRPF